MGEFRDPYRSPGEVEREPSKPRTPFPWGKWFERALGAILIVTMGSGAIALFWGLAYIVVADQTTQYCYIDAAEKSEIQQFDLHAYRGWGFSATIGTFTTPDEAIAVAQKMNCEFR